MSKQTKEERIKELEGLLKTSVEIIDEELMPHIATMAIQDFGRLNNFLMESRPILERAA